MNGSYYKTSDFPMNYNRETNYPGSADKMVDMPMEQSYIENILRLNKGKKVKAYYSFTDSLTHKDMVFSGVIEQAGRDHLIMSDPSTGKWYLIRIIYLNYVEFDERINYSHSYSEKTF